MNNIPKDCFIVGNKLMSKCDACGKIIRVDKFILGSLHICAEQSELQQLPKQFNEQIISDAVIGLQNVKAEAKS